MDRGVGSRAGAWMEGRRWMEGCLAGWRMRGWRGLFGWRAGGLDGGQALDGGVLGWMEDAWMEGSFWMEGRGGLDAGCLAASAWMEVGLDGGWMDRVCVHMEEAGGWKVFGWS